MHQKVGRRWDTFSKMEGNDIVKMALRPRIKARHRWLEPVLAKLLFLERNGTIWESRDDGRHFEENSYFAERGIEIKNIAFLRRADFVCYATDFEENTYCWRWTHVDGTGYVKDKADPILVDLDPILLKLDATEYSDISGVWNICNQIFEKNKSESL